MAEYVEKDKVIEWFRPYGHTGDAIPFDVLKHDIADLPAADVAPIVRCKDCKHSYEDLCERVCNFGPCLDCEVDDDFWCKHGERE